MTPQELLERARQLAASGPAPATNPGTASRRLLGIAGPPGAGKSTLATYLVRELGPALAALAPMDGFHLADTELRRLGRLDRKGAPDTFDPHGYAALLHRLRTPGPQETVYAPGFDRELEQPLAGCIPVAPEVPLVITEGNYLLLDQDPWPACRALLDECWWVGLEPDVRVRRLIARHERFGKSPAEAERWVLDSDESNAALVHPGRERADLVVEFTPGAAPDPEDGPPSSSGPAPTRASPTHTGEVQP